MLDNKPRLSLNQFSRNAQLSKSCGHAFCRILLNSDEKLEIYKYEISFTAFIEHSLAVTAAYFAKRSTVLPHHKILCNDLLPIQPRKAGKFYYRISHVTM
jgi:hypothetical protein